MTKVEKIEFLNSEFEKIYGDRVNISTITYAKNEIEICRIKVKTEHVGTLTPQLASVLFNDNEIDEILQYTIEYLNVPENCVDDPRDLFLEHVFLCRCLMPEICAYRQKFCTGDLDTTCEKCCECGL